MQAQPNIGSEVLVVTRRRSIHFTNFGQTELHTVRGQVIKSDRGDPVMTFRLNAGSKFQPVIHLEDVERIDYSTGAAGSQPKIQNKTWQIKGSKGDIYVVSQQGTKLVCDCKGFVFRNHCKHVAEVAALNCK